MATPESRFNIAASDRTRGAFQSAERRLQGLDRGLGRLKATVIGAVAGFVSFRGAVAAVEAFKKQEQALAKLNVTLVSMQRETAGLSKQLQGLAGQIQREGIIGDEAIIEGQAFLATFGKITDDMLPRTTRVLADLAARMGGDTARAALTLGKASEGLTGELTRVGISLSDRAKESKDFQLILAEIEQQVGGTNRALAQTATGALQQFRNAVGDVQEVLGELIAVSISPFVQDMTNRMLGFTGTVDENRTAFEAWARTAFEGTIEATRALSFMKAALANLVPGFKTLEAAYLDFVVEPIIAGTIKVQEALAKIPGVRNLIEPALEIRRTELEVVRDRLEEVRTEIVKAGDVFGDSADEFGVWAGQMRAAFDVAIEKSRELREGISRGGVAPRAPAAEEPDESSFGILGRDALDQMRDRLGQRLGIIRENLLSEREALIAHNEEQQQLIDDAMNMQIVSRSEAVGLLQELQSQHSARMIQLEQAQADSTLAIRSAVLQQAGQLLQVFAGKSKTAALAVIAIEKALGIAQTLKNTSVAIMRAYADLGPIAGAAAAAKIAVLGKLQVALIAATGLAQASQVGGGGANIGTPANPVTTQPSGLTLASPQPPQQAARIFNLQVRGLVTAEWLRDVLGPMLEEAFEDGAIRFNVQVAS